MKTLRLPLTLVCALAALVGCPAPAVVAPASPGGSKAPAVPTGLAAKATLEGVVTAPAGLVAAGAGNMVAAGAGNLIGMDGGSLVAAGGGNYALAQAAGAPLAGAEVVVTNGLGVPLPGVARAKTDAKGRYKLTGLPADGTFAVHVGFKTQDGANASTLVTLAEAGAESADVSASTTCVAVRLLGERGRAVKGFDREAFAEAVGVLDQESATDAPPPLWDRKRIMGWMGKLEARLDRLRASMDRVGARLDSIEAKLDELLAQRRNQASAAPSATPTEGSPTPTPTPTPAGSADPVATPTPAGPLATATPGSALKALSPTAGLTPDAVRDRWGQGGLMAVAASGAIWVASEGGATLLDATGKGERVFAFSGGRVQPRGMAADAAGNLWIADAYGGGAVRLTPAGQAGATEPATGATPVDVAVAADGSVWLASADKRIVHYAADGRKLGEVAPADGSPGAIAADAEGAIWVTYPTLGRVLKLDAAGKLMRGYDSGYPSGRLAVDGQGAAWTWTPDGVSRFGEEKFSVSSQARLYAADGGGNLWAVEDRALKTFDATGKALDGLTLKSTPTAIAAGPGGKIHVLLDGAVTIYAP